MNLKKIFAGMFGSNDPKYRTAKPWEMIFAGGTSAAKMAFYVLMMYASYAMNAGFGIAVTVTGIIIQAKTIFDGVTDPVVAVIYDCLPVFKDTTFPFDWLGDLFYCGTFDVPYSGRKI